jgi:sugar transferase (PEP-CTERM system associated)
VAHEGTYWHGETLQAESMAPLSGHRLKWFQRTHGASLIRIGGQYLPRKIIVLVASETVLILFALVLATLTNFLDLAKARYYLSQNATWLRFGLVIIVCQLGQYYSDLYGLQAMGSLGTQCARTVRAMGVAMLTLAVLYYGFPALRLERGITVLAALLAVSLIIAWRFSFGFTRGFFRPVESVLMLGTGQPGINLAQEILCRPELQYRVLGFLDVDAENIGTPLAEPGIIGGISQVKEIVSRVGADRLVISLAERRGVMPIRELTALKVQGVPIEDAHSMYERITGRIMLDRLRPSWLIMSDGFSKSQFLLAAKRTIDILASFVLIVLASPLLFLTWIAILVETGRPVFFRQDRVGLGGCVFKIFKFRSMRQGSEKGMPSWTADGDPRVTRVGNFIRKYRIDEIPQLFNVLRGEMSLIGPRPEVPYFCELLEREIPFYQQRHCVRPGISGWAQVKYKYGATLEEAKTKFEFDLFYIKNLSVLLDLTIIFETIKVVLLGKGAK